MPPMLGIMEVRLNFVTSFCGEYGRCWLWSKMEPELQNWCSRGGGEYAAADKSFFSVTRRAFLRRQTTLCPIFSSMISVVYCVARCICCVVLFASHCNDIGSGGKCTEKSESSTIFIIIFIVTKNFCHFHRHNSIPFSSNLNAFFCPSHQYIVQHLVILNVEKDRVFFPLPLSDITSRTSSSPLPPASPSEVASPGPSWSLRAFVRSVKTFN